MEEIHASSSSAPPTTSPKWTVYGRRWYVLSVITLTNVSGGILWMSLASVASEAALFYDVNMDTITFFSATFSVTVILLGLFAMWVLDKKGLRFGVRLGALLIAVGCSVRAASSAKFFNDYLSPKSKFYITLVGQIVAGCGQPFLFFTPSTVAEQWFPDHQRVLATTVIGMGTPLGLAIATLIPPYIIQRDHELIPLLNWLLCVPCIATLALVATIGTSGPPSPPSGSAAIVSRRPFIQGILELVTQKAFLLLLLYVGSVFGLFLALITLLEQILTTIDSRYSDFTCGSLASLFIGGGIFGAIIAAIIADSTKQLITVMKLSVAASCICLSVLLTIIQLHGIQFTAIKYIVAIIFFVTGFFGFMTYPLGLDLGIECAFPVASEATCNGLIIISGQLQAALYVGLMTGLSPYSFNNYRYSVSLTTQMSISVAIGCAFILLFHTEYNRMRNDRRTHFERIIDTNADSGVTPYSPQPSSIYS